MPVSGITSVTRSPARLTAPASHPKYAYGLAFPFQVAPRLAAAFVNIRVPGTALWDYEFGTDIILFDHLDGLSAIQTIELSRNREFTDAKSGARRLLLQGPTVGGFVPCGARHGDGAPHPHAGTGFGINQTLDFAAKGAGLFDWHDGWINRLEVHQLSSDGRQLRAEKTVLTSADEPLTIRGTDWVIVGPGLSNAIPEGNALLFPIQAENASVGVCGVSRWERTSGAWRPTAFLPVTPPHPRRPGENVANWSEPSLVRDADGSLLFHARCFDPKATLVEGNAVHIWRSADAGVTWRIHLHLTGLKREAPSSLNRAADGTPYLACSFPRIGRDLLCLWPLNAARDNIAGLVVARDAADEFGDAPGSAEWFARRRQGLPTKPDNPDYDDRPNRWWMDHPNGATLQLADGAWHHVLAYRGLTGYQVHGGAAPTPETGAYLEEVISKGPAIPAWTF